MDNEIFIYDSDKIKPIDKIEFGILGNDEIKRQSTLPKEGIVIAELYNNLEPKIGGLIDPHMGTTDSNIDCATCGLDTIKCVGHFGHIELAEPIFHFGFMEYIKKILSCICIRCSKLLINKNEDAIKNILKNKAGSKRLNDLYNLVKNVSNCDRTDGGCRSPIPKIKTEKTTGSVIIVAEYPLEKKDNEKNKIREILNADMCYNILSNISDEDCIFLGIDPKKNRPEMMIHKVFPVPPVQVRPSTRADFLASATMEDDLTHKLAEIVKSNLRVKKQKEKDVTEESERFKQDHVDLLQYHIASYFDNETLQLPKSEQKGHILKSLSARIKSKEGRIRGNLMGKRVDFSARTVITPDPTIDINQLGMPLKIAMNLTFPEVVTPNNIHMLERMVQNGNYKYPGATRVYPVSSINSGKVISIDLRFRKGKIDLHVGDIVERHLLNGDIVLLNRQPTLHKQSMMGHRVKILEDPNLLTFRLSVTVTRPYNADFDGDEMNVFLPQSILTQIELEELSDVVKQLITPSSSGTVYGLVQDCLIGAYALTSNDVVIDWKNAMNLLSYTSIDEFNKLKKKDISGRDLFSLILPKKINLSKYDDDKKPIIVIKNGQILDGHLSKDSLGEKKKNNIIQLVWDEYGVDEMRKFLDNCARLVNNYNLYRGFTIGIGDLYVNEDMKERIKTIFDTKEIKIGKMITDFENNPFILGQDLFEAQIFSEMDVIMGDISKLLNSNLPKNNNLNIIVSSGAKGSVLNIGQMCGCTGLQSFGGNLIPKRYNKRTLAYFFKNEDTMTARGFVRQSFSDGLKYPEFYFHNMTAREGLVDQAIKTADSGYIQRKLVKSMENLMIKYDGTLRTASNNIIQFVYGDTGADTTKQYECNMKFIELGDSELYKRHLFVNNETGYSKDVNTEYIKRLINLRDILRKSKFKSKMSYLLLETSFMIPVNLFRIVENAKNLIIGNTTLDASYVHNEIDKLIDPIYLNVICMTNDEKKDLNSIKNADDRLTKTSLIAGIYDMLSPKRCIDEYKFTKETFDDVINSIKNNYNKSLVEPGEMVGVIAAESMGECLTQMTLNAFHHSGIAMLGVSNLGVPRLREVLNLSRNIKEPYMVIHLLDGFKENKEMCNKIASYIKYTTIGDLINKIDVYYEPNARRKGSFIEQDNIGEVFHSFSSKKTSCSKDIDNLPWLLRIEIDKEKLLEKEVTLLDIKSKFCDTWEKRNFNLKSLKREEKMVLDKIVDCSIMSNSDNDIKPIIHIRFDMIDFNILVVDGFMNLIINNFKLKGLPNITNRVGVVEERCVVFDEDKKAVSKKHNVIHAMGNNMYDLRYINGVDVYNSTCNDLMSIFEMFGIEACRTYIIKELSTMYSQSGNFVNFHHLSVLSDIMCFNGFLVSIDRHGMNKSDSELLTRASFEKSVHQLISAAVFNETDHMKGVSSRIMAGLVMRGGTGLCNIYLDDDLIRNSEFTGISEKQTVEFEKDTLLEEMLE